MTTHTNASDTCTWYNYANKEHFDHKLFGTNNLRLLWEMYFVRLNRKKSIRPIAGVMLS